MHSTGKGTIFQIVCHRLVGRASEDIRYRSAGTEMAGACRFYKDAVPLERKWGVCVIATKITFRWNVARYRFWNQTGYLFGKVE